MLLGLIFFLILKGGLWTVTGAEEATPTLSPHGLAGIGALVGLFSKHAIDKLREVFQSLFRTDRQMAQKLVDSLPEDLQAEVRKHWKKVLGAGGSANGGAADGADDEGGDGADDDGDDAADDTVDDADTADTGDQADAGQDADRTGDAGG